MRTYLSFVDYYIWLHRCWWRLLETKCVGDKFEMLVIDSGCWWSIKYIAKITNITKKVDNIMILSPTSEISHHHNVSYITMSPTSLSTIYFDPLFCAELNQWWNSLWSIRDGYKFGRFSLETPYNIQTTHFYSLQKSWIYRFGPDLKTFFAFEYIQCRKAFRY